MSITCRDSSNKPLQYYTQWDSNQVLKISGLDTSAVPVFHFFNKYSKVALVVSPIVSEASIVVKVPNILLQQATPLVVQLYYQNVDNSAKTEHTLTIPVRPKPKPADYEYKENIDYVSLEMLDARMQQIIEAISNSSTAANSAELLDMRTSYDGVVYDTAGEAIRAVTKELYDAIRKSTDAQWDSHSETIFEYVDLDNIISGYSGDKSLLNIYIFDESEVPQKGNYLGILDDINDNSILLINKATGEQWSYIKGSNVLIENRYDFINLGEFADIKRLDLSLVKYNHDTSKLYRFSFKNDIETDGGIIPGEMFYIGYIDNIEPHGLVVVFETIVSDGIKRFIGLENNVYNYWEEPVITVDTKQDFLNSGDFKTLEEIHSYGFQYEKIYRINITEDIKDDNDVIELPKGLYFGYMYYSTTADDFLELLPFVPDGKVYTIIHGSSKSHVYHSYTSDQTFDPESENAQSGIAVAEAVNDVVFTQQTGIITSFKELFDAVNPSAKEGRKSRVSFVNVINLTDNTTNTKLPAGKYYCIGSSMSLVVNCLDLDNSKSYAIKQNSSNVDGNVVYNYEVTQLGSDVVVEQTFNPESENAQSGKALEEALETRLPASIDGLNHAYFGGEGVYIPGDYTDSSYTQDNIIFFDWNEGEETSIKRCSYSALKENIFKIADVGGYYESDGVEGALQEIGATLNGLEDFLASI